MAHVESTPDLAAMRRAYDAAGIDPATVALSWRVQFAGWVQDAFDAQLPEPNAMTVATVDADGRPSCRTVLCKRVDDRGFVFFTNRDSRKGRALRANPRAALTFVWLALQRQVCVTGNVEEVSRGETLQYARQRPRGSQLSAWASPQSSVIASREVLTERRDELERELAGSEDVPVADFWGGFRVLPITVEFWSGRPDRLHDRVRYRRADGVPGDADDSGWVTERLAP
jgi:pyridoxamine 5'-phosphate oxidase